MGMADVHIKEVVKPRQGSRGDGTRRGIRKVANASLTLYPDTQGTGRCWSRLGDPC